MNKICPNCGHELNETAKFCGKCGIKISEIIETKLFCSNCGNELSENAKFCPRCGEPQSSNSSNHVSKEYQEKLKQYATVANEQRDKFKKYADAANKHGTKFIHEMENKTRTVKIGKRKFIIGAAVVVVLLAVFCIFKPGVSDKVVGNAALQIAEQDYGYQLELEDYDIVDSFTAKSEYYGGEKIKAKMHLVIIDAVAKDNNGTAVEDVTYGVIVVDPKKSHGTITYSAYSQAVNYTGMSHKEIKKYLKDGTAQYH